MCMDGSMPPALSRSTTAGISWASSTLRATCASVSFRYSRITAMASPMRSTYRAGAARREGVSVRSRHRMIAHVHLSCRSRCRTAFHRTSAVVADVAASFGIFVLVELPGEAGRIVREIQERYDPKLARLTPPHVTLVGSSGVGAIPSDTPVDRIASALAPIAARHGADVAHLRRPVRFMQTDIISLPLDPHGPLRTLHERIATSGLPFKPARFLFTPHCTLNFYRTLTRETERELLALRVTAPVVVDRLQVYLTRDPQPSRKLMELSSSPRRTSARPVGVDGRQRPQRSKPSVRPARTPQLEPLVRPASGKMDTSSVAPKRRSVQPTVVLSCTLGAIHT